MKEKRLELYLGWRCNFRCEFCIERENIKEFGGEDISKKKIFKKLLKFRKKGYNFVTFLGGEPFLQNSFLESAYFAKKIGYKTLVNTNGFMLQFNNRAKRLLENIDQLILSINSLKKSNIKKINNTTYLSYEKIFNNIEEHFNGDLLRVNTVLCSYNIKNIVNLIEELIVQYSVKDFSITYPSITEDILKNKKEILISYEKAYKYLKDLKKIKEKYNFVLHIRDIPYCILKDMHIYSEDKYFQNNIKDIKLEKDFQTFTDREKEIPRNRSRLELCESCIYSNECWGVDNNYPYNLDCIKPFKE